MPVSEAQKKASVRYLEKLDEVRIRMPKGNKAVIQAHAAAQGESVNGFIIRAIDEAMERDGLGGPTGPAEAGGIPTPEPHKTAQSGPQGPQAGIEDKEVFL